MSTIVWFTLPSVEGTIPICVVEGGEVLGWTTATAPSDVEYEAWRFVESLETASDV